MFCLPLLQRYSWPLGLSSKEPVPWVMGREQRWAKGARPCPGVASPSVSPGGVGTQVAALAPVAVTIWHCRGDSQPYPKPALGAFARNI